MSFFSRRVLSFVVPRVVPHVVAGSFALFLLFSSFTVFAGPVDINTADANTFATELIGIGASKAAAIVAYREANGPFKRLEDLINVKGVGEKTLEKNRAMLMVQEKQ